MAKKLFVGNKILTNKGMEREVRDDERSIFAMDLSYDFCMIPIKSFFRNFDKELLLILSFWIMTREGLES